MKVAILDDYLNVAIDLGDWSILDGRAELFTFNAPFGSEDEAADKLADYEVIVGMRERTPFPASLIKRLPVLKLLITTGMRNQSFDMEAAKAQGVTVCGTAGLGQPTAELTWAMILGLACHIPEHDNAMKSGGWQMTLNEMLKGKTLGLLGLGKLGGTVGEIGKAFGMRVIAWSQNLTAELAGECGVTRVEKDELIAQSDYISIHLVLSDRTRGLINADDLAQMKPTAYIVNTSRGPIIDERALIEALKENKIAGAAIDVYEIEPLPADHPIRSLDNVLLTPHIGYGTNDNFAHMYSQVAENIAAFLDGAPIRLLNG
ncbi:MAG: D-2-hydroxyacid dehydrogenase family protein [Pseudomonadota bacterium]|nr:D-2-hydroxyacid dehydrogenase family protein [Pseudomonadota bacterium]